MAASRGSRAATAAARRRAPRPALLAQQGDAAKSDSCLAVAEGAHPSAAARRWFARKRTRLDEYNTYDAPLRLAEWRKAKQDGEGFYAYSFEDMSASEIVETVHLAVKTRIESKDFWHRASVAMGDAAHALNAKQIATACHAFGAARWRDESLVAALAPALAAHAHEMRPGDVAVTVQALARNSVTHAGALRALSRAAATNPRMAGKGFAMITESFAHIGFYDDGYLRRLDRWTEEQPGAPTSLEAVVMLHSLSRLMPLAAERGRDAGQASGSDALPALHGPTGPGASACAALCKQIRSVAKALEPQPLQTAVIALARLRLADEETVSTFQRVVAENLHNLGPRVLPSVLDSFTQLFEAQDGAATASHASPPEKHSPVAASRRQFIGRLSGRLARELYDLRPQDITRALQAVERAGLLDPYLLREAAETIPAQLGMRPPEETVRLLAAYASAGNRDTFMVPCLRRALLPAVAPRPIGAAWEGEDDAHGAPGPIDGAAIANVEDVRLVGLVQAFGSLGHSEGIVALFLALEAGDLNPSVSLALAGHAVDLLRDEADWGAAADALWRGEPALRGSDWRLVPAATGLRERWLTRGDASAAEADDLVFAVGMFPGHPMRAEWEHALAARIDECSAALLPGLLRKSQAPVLDEAAASCWARRFAAGECNDMPLSALVAAARGLSSGVADPTAPKAGGEFRRTRLCVAQIVSLVLGAAKDEALPAKAVVRLMQSCRAVGIDPPPGLLQAFAASGAGLTPAELLVALGLVPNARAVRDSDCADELAALSVRAMAQVKSSRLAWRLHGLCKSLELDIADVEAAVPGGSDDEEELHGKVTPR